MFLVRTPRFAICREMLSEEGDLEFIRHATAELALSFTDQHDHNLHAVLNGLLKAIEADRSRLTMLEAELEALRARYAASDEDADS